MSFLKLFFEIQEKGAWSIKILSIFAGYKQTS